jgi:CRP-like cAMP-binding protein
MTAISRTHLTNLGPFRTLTPDQIDELRPHLEDHYHEPGHYLFREGDPGNALYIIVEGRVEVSKRVSPDESRILATVGDGAVLGEMSLIVDNTRSASARCLAPTRHLKLPKPVYQQLMDNDSLAALKLTLALTRILSQRLRALDEAVVREDREDSEPQLTEFEAFRRHILPAWSF